MLFRKRKENKVEVLCNDIIANCDEIMELCNHMSKIINDYLDSVGYKEDK
ncbi:hypothetical protein [Clostridium cibarium]|uniref:Spo0E like sporulation regulatory protein n=1 Tax=Clostridium cibarium TaxID=2762247 RepID=A0ABR8PNJ6_9CLOT|nr:hypothetical protein [Clostridium cibarium]MBD7909736.1 hypothetical protein [Clostridium cibarium]